jgi:hypothetical protein
MLELSLDVKSLKVELRDLARLLRLPRLLLLEWELNNDMEEGSSPTGVSGRLGGQLSDVRVVGRPNVAIRPSVNLLYY